MTSRAQRFVLVTSGATGVDAAVCQTLAGDGLASAQALARKMASRRIMVNSAVTAVIDASMPRFSFSSADDEKVSSAAPLGRLKPGDVAAMCFLVSPADTYIPVATIDTNGGYRMQ